MKQGYHEAFVVMAPKKIISVGVFFLTLFFLGVAKAQAATLYWVGANGANASVPSNWSTTNPTSCSTNVTPSGTIPGSVDQMNFDADCDNGTNVDSSFSATVSTIVLTSGYTGTVTLSNPLATSSSVTISGGTLTGTSSLSVGTTFALTGGTANMASFTSYTASSTTTASTGTLTLSSTANTLAALTINGGTVTQSAGTFSASSTVNLSSGSLTLANGADLNSGLTISGGTFTAPSGTMSVAGTLTITNYPATTVFNANSGTINIDGTTGTFACSNVPFNMIVFSTTGSKTISNDCSLPLGANPTIAGTTLTLRGSLTGSGTLTKSSGTLTMDSGSPTIVGFNTLSLPAMTVSGATVNLSTTDTIILSSTLTISSGSFTGPSSTLTGVSISQSSGTVTCTSGSSWSSSATFTVSGATVGMGNCNLDLNVFILSSGSMTAPTAGKSFTVASTMTFSSTGDFISNGGTTTFDGGVATLTCNNEPFSMVVFTHTSGAKTVSSSCSFPMGNNPSATNNITVNGELSGSGTLLLTRNLTLNNGSSLTGFSGLYIGNLVIDTRTLDLSNFSPVVMYSEFASNSVNLTNGATLIAPTGNMDVYNDVHFENGTFIHSNGTIVLHSSSFATNIDLFLGSSHAYNLTTDMRESFLLRIASGSTAIIDGNLSLIGASTSVPLLFQGGNDGTQRVIDARGSRVLRNLDVRDSNNINSNVMICSSCTDSGNNTNWDFSSEPIELELSSPDNNAYIYATRPTFRWKAAIDGANSSIHSYSLEVQNSDSEHWSISDIPAYQPSDYETEKYIAHYEHFDDEDVDNNTISVSTKSSTSWGDLDFDGNLKEGKRSWKVTALDGVGNSVSRDRTLFVDTTSPMMKITQLDSVQTMSESLVTNTVRPTLFGVITDSLSGEDDSTTTQSDAGPKIASGPKQITVTVEKKIGPLYTPISKTTISISQMKFTCDDKVISNNAEQSCDKYSTFSFSPENNLSSGIYRITLSGEDNAGNTTSTILSLRINGSVQRLVDSLQGKLKPQKPQPAPLFEGEQNGEFHKNLNQLMATPRFQELVKQVLYSALSYAEKVKRNITESVAKLSTLLNNKLNL